MRISEQWLRTWVDPDLRIDALASQLTMAGLEIDAIAPAAAPVPGVVVGRVVEVAPHPSADRLRVCQVDVGGETLGIVCGAQNVRPGLRVAAALEGATLPNGTTIRTAKLRGVESRGMLCSAVELGLAESSEGLIELPDDAPVGETLVRYMGLDDSTLEVDLTPNRGDCLSVAGLAREVGVLNRAAVRGPVDAPVPPATNATFPVVLTSPDDCPRYLGRVVEGVDPAARTPLWMQERLRRSGQRSLGPLVDVTNYVMLELGQPMHAFDLDRLSGGIEVRRARPGERLALLNGQTIELDGDVLVIADANGAVAMAGVMGGEPTAVGDSTRRLFLESAFFAPAAISGRARRYGLATDSAQRFERGVDPVLARRAMERATALLLEITGGRPGPVIEAVEAGKLPAADPIRLRRGRIERVLGLKLDDETIVEILTRLGARLEDAADGWTVTPPSHRFDLRIEEDLLEELVRVHGYNRVPSTRPVAPLQVRPTPEGGLSHARLRAALVDRGYQEAITYSFVPPDLQSAIDPDVAPLALANPISADMSVMRTSLLCGLLQALRHNQNRQQERVRLFETGLCFRPERGGLRQEPMVAAVMAGPAEPEQWGTPGRAIDFYDAKSDVEALLGLTGGCHNFIFTEEKHPALHPGQTAAVMAAGRRVGWIGVLHPALAKRLDLRGRVVVFELEASAFQESALPKYSALSPFPASRRDLAVVVDEGVRAADLADAVRRAAGEELIDFAVFDVYRGAGLEPGKKSVALGLTLQGRAGTLTDADLDARIGGVLTELQRAFKAKLRD